MFLLPLVPVVMVVWLAVMMYLQFRGQESAKARLEPADAETVQNELGLVLPLHEWALANEFELVGGYLFEAPFNPRTFFMMWQHRREPTRIGAFIRNGVHVDFLTHYEGDVVLTTTGSSAVGLFPARQGAYKQAFSPYAYEGLWVAHREGDELLRARFGLGHVATLPPVEEDFLVQIAQIARFIRSIWFWWLRVWYWYITRASRMNVPLSAEPAAAAARDDCEQSRCRRSVGSRGADSEDA